MKQQFIRLLLICLFTSKIASDSKSTLHKKSKVSSHKSHQKKNVPLEVLNQEKRLHITSKVNWNPEIINSLLGSGITSNY
jgi:hypothetical protein